MVRISVCSGCSIPQLDMYSAVLERAVCMQYDGEHEREVVEVCKAKQV